jgi:hypothetical protein
MNAMAKSVGRSSNRKQSSGNRQVIVLVGLLVVLVIVLAFELPGLLHKSSSGSSSVTTTTAATTAASSSATSATATAAAPVQSVVKVSAATRTERYIKRLPARDPFLPLAGEKAAVAAAAPVVAAPAPAPTPAAPTPAPAPKVVATSAVIWTNGTRQIVGLKQLFRVGDTSFRLLSVGKSSVKVAVAVGGFKNGAKTITIAKNKPVTIQNTITGAQYNLRFTLAMTAVGGR